MRIIPKDKKLLKSSKVRKWLKHSTNVITAQLTEQQGEKKIAEAITLGVPLMIYDDGRIEVVKDYYRKKTK